MHTALTLGLCIFFVARTTEGISRLYDKGSCYQQYIPQESFLRARCRRPLGGNPAENGMFIRNAITCCKTRSANGWGYQSSCQSCTSVRGFLLPWTEWSICSKTCGKGEQKRYRYCSNGVCAGVRGRRITELRTCVWKTCCPVDGNWGFWSPWSDCTASCGHGLQYRTRSCSSPAPICGGKPCRSYPRQMQRCSVEDCAKWSSWAPHNSCSVSCGTGIIKRMRMCHNPLGDKCIGESVDYLSCDQGSCAVNGHWCNWYQWSPCTTSCQHTQGTRKRSRTCECPKPENNGEDCPESDGDVVECSSLDVCPIKGKWSAWSSWSSCSSQGCSITIGKRVRTRTCIIPESQVGSCDGSDVEDRSCIDLEGCLVEGSYGKWSTWTPCTLSCGSCGVRLRSRNCYHLVDAPDTEILGNPEFYCNSSKELFTEKCHAGVCDDGTNPCNITNENEKEQNIASISNDIFNSISNDGEDFENEASTDEEYYPDYLHRHDLGSGGDEDKQLSDNWNDDFNLPTIPEFNDNDIFTFDSNEHTDLDQDIFKLAMSNSTLDDENESINGIHATHEGKQRPRVNNDFDSDDGSGSFDESWNYNPGKKLVAGCDELHNMKGKDKSKTDGCCGILSSGMNGNTTSDRLEECLALHFEAVIGSADDMIDEDQMQGRGVVGQRCHYQDKERLLHTICCLKKVCQWWRTHALQKQCKICRGLEKCQSCHNLLLSG